MTFNLKKAEAKKKLSHLDAEGKVRMVDVSKKTATRRKARAESFITISDNTCNLIEKGEISKGNVEAVVKIAGIQAAKRTWELIPLCHPLMLDRISVEIVREENGYRISVEAENEGKTGVEMEAMTGAAAAALAFYDMIKGIERGAEIKDVRLISKEGGKSGKFFRG